MILLGSSVLEDAKCSLVSMLKDECLSRGVSMGAECVNNEG
jgi:hypothetical protein